MLNPDTVRVAVAPINWTNDDMPELGGEIPLVQCLDEMQEGGYVGCEVGVKFPSDPAELKPLLEARGLQVCNQWMSYRFTTHPFDVVKQDFIKCITFLSEMGASIIGGGEVGTSIQGREDTALYIDKPTNSSDVWKQLCSGLNKLGKLAREEYGFTLCFHHHMGTCVQTMAEIEVLLHETNPDYVSLNYDCGHIYASEEDPVAALRKFASRVGHIHIKDVRKPIMEEVQEEKLSFLEGIRRGFFTVPGDGVLADQGAYKEMFSLLTGYSGWLVVEAEQDPKKAPPLEYAKMGRAFIQSIAGV